MDKQNTAERDSSSTKSEEQDEFEVIFDSLVAQNDQYFVLRDFASYLDTQIQVGEAYLNKNEWWKKSLTNIAKSGHFSSDRTIQQ